MAPQSRMTIDWSPVRERLARQNAALEEIFAGRGPWAEALLDRRAAELAAEEGGEASRLARPTLPVLVARGAGGLYGLELRRLLQVVPLPRIARVPGAVPELLGVIAVGGKVMRIFDLDRLCGVWGEAAGGTERQGSGPGGHALVLRTGNRRPAALRVAGVERVTDVARPESPGGPEGGGLLRGLTPDRVAVIDMDLLIDAVTAG